MKRTLLLSAYRALARASGPLLPTYLARRERAGKEDAARLSERRGVAFQSRPDAPLIWMHGASVGECTMLLSVIHHVQKQRPDIAFLITSGTRTSADLLAAQLPPNATHQYAPLDHPGYVGAFLDHWQPELAIWAESEIWPNLITATRKRGIKMALINARMSERSRLGWAKRPKTARTIFGAFDTILAADHATARALSRATGREISNVGNIKDAAPPLPVDTHELTALKAALASRAVWCAASTHAGEDAAMVAAHQQLLNAHPDALLILAPRHPERAGDIARLCREAGLTTARRSLGQTSKPKTQIWIMDSIGDMGLAYRLASVSFVAGSTQPHLSGHNPVEPARLGSAVLSGLYVESFLDVYDAMQQGDAVMTIDDVTALGATLTQIFNDPKRLNAMQKTAVDFAISRADMMDKVWVELAPLMPAREARS